jgi:hypothetical protein
VADLPLKLEENFEIRGFVKPSTRLEVKTNTGHEETEKLTREDVVVVWGGSKDFEKSVLFPRC